MQITYGSYTGNGSDNRGITGIGFAPELVIIKGDTTQHAIFKTSSLIGDNTLTLSQSIGAFADAIQSLDSDGFTIGGGAYVNSNSITYYWVAVRAAGGGDFNQGSYSGNGADNRNITGVGFQPSIVVIKADSTAIARMKDSSDAGENTHHFTDNWTTSNEIQAFQTDGFQIGSEIGVNASGVTYYWFAFRADTGEITINSYTGNSTDNRNITGVGFNPRMVWILDAFITYPGNNANFKTSSMIGDLSMLFTNATGITNRIQSFQSDGFQIGDDTDVNATGSTYHYIAFQEQSANTTTSTSTSTTTTTSTTTSTSTTSTSSSTTSTSSSTSTTSTSTSTTSTSTTSTSTSTTSTSTTTTLEYVYSVDEGV